MGLALSTLAQGALAAPSRALQEPPAIAVAASAAQVSRAVLTSAGCTRSALSAPGLVGLRCRLVAAAFAPPSTELQLALADVDRALWRYQPVSARRELPRERYLAHRQACLSLARLRSPLGCACGLRNLEVTPEDMSAKEIGPLQIELSTHLSVLGCSALEQPERGGPKSVFSPRDAALARELVKERLSAVVESRRFELKRCVDRHAPFGFVRAHERAPLASCACRVARRWRFPSASVGSRSVQVAVTGDKTRDVLVTLSIADSGTVSACSDLEVRSE